MGNVCECWLYSDSVSVFSSVRISTIPAFGTIMETVTQKEVQGFATLGGHSHMTFIFLFAKKG